MTNVTLLYNWVMEDITAQIKETVMEQIIQHMMTTGSTKKDACQMFGMTTRTFDRHIAAQPELASRLVEANRQEIMERYSDIHALQLTAMDTVLSRLKDGFDGMEISEILMVEGRLQKWREKLEGSSPSVQKDAFVAGAVAAASFIKRTPQLRKVTARDDDEVIDAQSKEAG